jgi:hypothetical protein
LHDPADPSSHGACPAGCSAAGALGVVGGAGGTIGAAPHLVSTIAA